MKSQKMSWPWELGLRNHIWATWVQKTYQAKSRKPWFQFSQTGLHFLTNHKMNPMKLWNLKKYLDLEVWGLETTFVPLGIKRLNEAVRLNVIAWWTHHVEIIKTNILTKYLVWYLPISFILQKKNLFCNVDIALLIILTRKNVIVAVNLKCQDHNNLVFHPLQRLLDIS